jgi:hypothetical protein
LENSVFFCWAVALVLCFVSVSLGINSEFQEIKIKMIRER